MPAANARWRLALGRSRRSACGSSNIAGSWLAAPSTVSTIVARAARRHARRRRPSKLDRHHRHAHGVLHRSVEAQQLVDGSVVERRVVAPHARAGRGGAAARATPLPIRLTVVSWPATYSSTTNEISSAGLSRSPASSTTSSADSRSSPRFARRSSMIVDEVRDQAAPARPRRRRGRRASRSVRARR